MIFNLIRTDLFGLAEVTHEENNTGLNILSSCTRTLADLQFDGPER